MKQDVKKIVRIISISLFIFIIVVFAFINSKDLIFGVKIKNVNIVDGSKVTNNIFEVTGVAKNAVNVTLNGREISIDKNGNFDENIVLSSGYNIITITAKDKFGKRDEKVYKLMY